MDTREGRKEGRTRRKEGREGRLSTPNNPTVPIVGAPFLPSSYLYLPRVPSFLPPSLRISLSSFLPLFLSSFLPFLALHPSFPSCVLPSLLNHISLLPSFLAPFLLFVHPSFPFSIILPSFLVSSLPCILPSLSLNHHSFLPSFCSSSSLSFILPSVRPSCLPVCLHKRGIGDRSWDCRRHCFLRRRLRR